MVGESVRGSLKVLVASYVAAQKDRIASENRIRTMELLPEVQELLSEKAQEDREWERKIRKMLTPLLDSFDEWVYWMKYVRGLGPTLAAKYLAVIDWNKVRYPSSLYMYFGLICDEKGRAYRPKRGEKAPFDRKKKALVFNTVQSFIKKGGGYRRLFDRFKKAEEQKKRFTIKVRDLDEELYVGHLLIEDGKTIALTKQNIKKIKQKYSPDDEIVLERTGKHRFYRAVRKVGKVFLSHMVMFHYWFNYRRLVLAYPLVYCDGHGNYVYMPVLDVSKDELNDDKFMWWHTLYDAIKDDGRKPVVL